MIIFPWNFLWLAVAGLLCGLYLIWDARRAVKSGEFGGILGLVKKPVRKADEPRLFWSLVAPCLGAGLAGVAAGIIALFSTIARIP